MNPYLQQYQKTQVTTADQGKLILMMYEAAMSSIKLAKEGLERKNLSAKGKYLGRAISLVNELRHALDRDRGGDIAMNLERIYFFVTDQLSEANIQNQTEPMEVALKILEELYDGWSGIFKNPGAETRAEQPQAVP